MANNQNLKPCKPGETHNPNGRPKKWVSTLRDIGYKKSEIMDCIQVLISMDEQELNEVAKAKDVTVMEQVVALALLESIKKKTLYNIETLLTRVYGQPKLEIDGEIKVTKFDVKFNDDGDNVPQK